MRKAIAAVAVLVTSAAGLLQVGETAAEGAQSQSAQGVTPTSIKVGVTYPDVAAIRNVINVDPGNYQVAYTALFDQINAHGGHRRPQDRARFRRGRPPRDRRSGHGVHAAHGGRQGVRRLGILPGRRWRLLPRHP